MRIQRIRWIWYVPFSLKSCFDFLIKEIWNRITWAFQVMDRWKMTGFLHISYGNTDFCTLAKTLQCYEQISLKFFFWGKPMNILPDWIIKAVSFLIFSFLYSSHLYQGVILGLQKIFSWLVTSLYLDDSLFSVHYTTKSAII
jgi:hypothetical protein